MTAPSASVLPPIAREATPRRYLMCPPVHFTVRHEINVWMDPAAAAGGLMAFLLAFGTALAITLLIVGGLRVRGALRS